MNDTERELSAALRREEQALPPRTLARIAGARQAALQTQPRHAWLPRLLAPAMGAAVLAGALGIAVFLPQQAPQATVSPDAAALSEDPELYRDLDFYIWLAESDMGSDG